MTSALPQLDLRAFTAGTQRQRADFVEDLRQAAHGVGFFYLRGYSSSEALPRALLQAARVFFALPQEQKNAIHMVHSAQLRGYTAAGEEITRGARDWREQLDTGAERPLIEQGPGVPPWTRLQGPNQWPASLPALKPLVLEWQDAMTQTGLALLRALALALGQREDTLLRHFEGQPVQHTKLIRYAAQGRGTTAQGVGPHKDSGCLTLLLQDLQGGLQVLDREAAAARWIDVPPLEGTLVINLGEVLEMWSDGFLRATTHRVVSPQGGKIRYSAAFFLTPRLESELHRLELPAELAGLARGVERDPLNPLIAHTGSNLLKGRLRSHRDVAARHYSALPALA